MHSCITARGTPVPSQRTGKKQDAASFHAFGKAKKGAQAALRDLEKQGWETLPTAILGMPNLPPAWMAFFFSRARTPCGRCAQVIVEGKETQHIDGEK